MDSPAYLFSSSYVITNSLLTREFITNLTPAIQKLPTFVQKKDNKLSNMDNTKDIADSAELPTEDIVSLHHISLTT